MDDADRSRLLKELVDRHYRLVYRFCVRLTGSPTEAEDLTQQAFLSAQLKLPQLRDPARAGGWLCAIARNTWLKDNRGPRGERQIALDRIAEPSEDAPSELALDANELQEALHELPEEFRTPVILFYFEDFSYRDIAEQLGVPLGTIMSRLARAKTHLRRRLAAQTIDSHTR